MEQTHPNVHGVLSPLVERMAEIHGISPHHEEEYGLLRAGAALPYLMASTTRMEGYLPHEYTNDRLWKIIVDMDTLSAN